MRRLLLMTCAVVLQFAGCKGRTATGSEGAEVKPAAPRETPPATKAPPATMPESKAAPAPAPASPAIDRVHLARLGTFHGDEVSASDGDSVFALYQADDRWRLERHRVAVKPAHDPVHDSDDQATGKAVSLATDPDGALEAFEPVLLLGGATFEAGRVVAASYDPDCLGSDKCRIALGERQYEVDISREQIEVEGELRPSLTLKLSEGSRRSTVGSVASVYFLGDLDGDGRLDLLVSDGPFHYNVSESYALYLSSRAGAGAVVGKAAAFQSVGG